MAEDKGKKGRVLFLEHYLQDNTDEDHAVTKEQIVAEYEKNGYSVSKNTFTDDIKTLEECGVAVKRKANSKPEAYYVDREFERAELRALIDAVSFAQFFTIKKSDQLIRKICGLAAKPGRKNLVANVYSLGRRKTGSLNVNVAIETVLKAIRDQKQISFKYVDYDENKEIYFRNNGKRYQVSPYALILDNNRYYVPAYNPAREKTVNWRIDRMRAIQEEEEVIWKSPDFNYENYTKTNIGMYSGDEPETEVILQTEKWHMSSLVDFFGDDVETVYDPEKEKIRAFVKVKPGRTFFSWVTGFAGEMMIVGPADVRKSYEEMLGKLLASQNK